jgi:glutaredoxin-like YruB-family protein
LCTQNHSKTSMHIFAIHSFEELEKELSQQKRSFLLLYKSGADQSVCALKRLSHMEVSGARVYSADVNRVRDIHPRLQVSTAPSLVIFENNKVINIVKGCQTESAYGALLSGRMPASVSQDQGAKQKQVIVYTTPSCSWCTTLKTYLDQKQVRYREINVASDSAAAEAMVRKSGQQGVPQTEINGQVVVGFDQNRINQLLEIK